MVRPHVVFPNELPPDFYKALLESFPGSGDAYVPIDQANWDIITNGMYEVTQPGLYHTAGAEGLPGIDFAGKTGTAQQMSHQALEKTNKGKSTYPNVWFVGVTPRRNPELVVAVLWQNGEFSWYPARIGAQVVEAFVNKKRRLAHNLAPEKAAASASPVEVGAVWSIPSNQPGVEDASKISGGHFFVGPNGMAAESTSASATGAKLKAKPAAPRSAEGSAASSAELASAPAARRREP